MPMPLLALLFFVALAPVAAWPPQAPPPVQRETFDYWRVQRDMIQRGQQALIMCNGLFTSGRTLGQVFAQELKIVAAPIGTAAGGNYTVDRPRRAVAVGTSAGPVPVMRAAFREGLGCIVLAPDQTFDDIDRLPILTTPPPPGNPTTTAWPEGDVVPEAPLPAGIDPVALQAASDWAFTRESPEQVTLSLLVVHQGRIVHERYASGVNVATRTRTWSTAKSLAATLIGLLVDQGRMTLDGPLNLPWLPAVAGAEHDPRAAMTLRHLLNMSSGLYPVDNAGLEYATGSGLAYWAGASSERGARQRALIRAPGAFWDYENYDTLAAVAAMKRAIGSDRDYLAFPRQALLDRLGMRHTIISTDRFGDFVLSSQVYTNARDLARLGLLYLRNGMWGGERLLSEAWIRFVRTPAPATKTVGSQYGGHFWLVPDTRTDVPKDAYATNGNRGQYTIIVPSHDLVIVRRGLDYGRQGFNPWDLTREVLKSVKSGVGMN